MRNWDSNARRLRQIRRQRARHPRGRVDSIGPMRHSKGMARSKDWNRLADYVVGKRSEEGITQIDLAQRMGVDVKTVRRIEAGNSVAKTTLAKIDRAFHEPAGTARAVLDGTSPGHDQPKLEDEVEYQIWAIKGLPDEEKWSFIDLHRARKLRVTQKGDDRNRRIRTA